MAAIDTLKVGDLIGRHKLIEKIGQCPMGEVWIAFSNISSKQVLTKFVLWPRPDELRRFEDEAARLGAICPEGFCYTDGGWEAGRTSYLVVELPDMGNGNLDGLVSYLELSSLQPPQGPKPGEPGYVDPKVEMYTLAAMMFKLMTGRLPFGAPEERQDIRQAYMRIPPELQPVFARALSPDPAKSMANPGELAMAMRAVVPQVAPPPMPMPTIPDRPMIPDLGPYAMQPYMEPTQAMVPAQPYAPIPQAPMAPIATAPVQPGQVVEQQKDETTRSLPMVEGDVDRRRDTIFLVTMSLAWALFGAALIVAFIAGFQHF